MKKNKKGAEPSRLRPNRQMLRRTAFMMALCGIGAFSVLGLRLYQLMIVDHRRYEAMAIEQQMRSVPSSVNRGTIYDSQMRPLAISATVENVYLSPAEIQLHGEDRALIARGLSEILGLDYDELYDKTGRNDSWYVTVARKLEREQADKVRAFKLENQIKGLHLESDTKRYYPNSTLACHLVGFVGLDNYGLEGLEAQYDQTLTGSRASSYRATNALGTQLLFSRFEDIDPGKDGYDLVTTIDSSIQYFLEKHLEQAVRDYDVLNGAGAIAMDVDTGAILGMASLGNYDPNHFLELSSKDQQYIDQAADEQEREKRISKAQIRQWRNKALSDTYEPGSTFKIITLAMALEEGVTDLEDSFYCPGSVEVLGRNNPIRCWKHEGHGSQDLTQAAQHSCNVAFVNIGMRVGAERFYDYCEAFGLLDQTEDPAQPLSAKTGIDLAGESGSIWWSRNTFCDPKNLSQLAAASFGQTFTITPLQLITAVSACVNGGELMQPYVVQRLLEPDGSLAYERQPKALRQVISPETSQKLRHILERVVGDSKEGTGRNAAVTGYEIGGKTGTSEKVSLEAQTGQKEYIVSFIGFAPADDPKIALLVYLDTPSGRSGVYVSGGQMAAPVVGNMLADILPYMGIEPKGRDALADVAVPLLLDMDPGEAQAVLEELGLRCRIEGSGGRISYQLPASGSAIALGSQVLLWQGGSEESLPMCSVPRLNGLSYEQARDVLESCGLYISTRSQLNKDEGQTVVSQSIPAGTSASPGCVIEVSLVDSEAPILGKY